MLIITRIIIPMKSLVVYHVVKLAAYRIIINVRTVFSIIIIAPIITTSSILVVRIDSLPTPQAY